MTDDKGINKELKLQQKMDDGEIMQVTIDRSDYGFMVTIHDGWIAEGDVKALIKLLQQAVKERAAL